MAVYWYSSEIGANAQRLKSKKFPHSTVSKSHSSSFNSHYSHVVHTYETLCLILSPLLSLLFRQPHSLTYNKKTQWKRYILPTTSTNHLQCLRHTKPVCSAAATCVCVGSLRAESVRISFPK